MQNAPGRAAHQLRLRIPKRGARIVLLAGGDRGLDLFDGRADARRAALIDAGALGALDGPLLRGLDIGMVQPLLRDDLRVDGRAGL